MGGIAKHLIVKPGNALQLADVNPDKVWGASKEEAAKQVKRNIEQLAELGYRLYAENRRSLLVVLQGMDAAGKDGTIRHVMTGLNPQSCSVTSFKAPSAEELAHDFLWRVHHATPAKGHIGIFNRSHYEDVLVVRVRGLAPQSVWRRRYEQINQFERMLTENDVVILKFFLHISKREQGKRLKERLADPSKNWKFTLDDVKERQKWQEYMKAYQGMLSKCSTPWAPWFVIPADHKWFRNYAISTIILDTLKAMDPQIPKASKELGELRIR